MPSLDRPVLGKWTCLTPGCGHPVTVREDRNGRAYYTCGECSAQHFSKGPRADAKFRAALKPAAPAPAVAPAAKPAAAKPTPTPAPAKSGHDWS